MSRDLIVTGIPRGGTTLLAALIDTSPNAVCLSEPALHQARSGATRSQYAAGLLEDFRRLRGKITSGEPVLDQRSPTGERVTNYLSPDAGQEGRSLIAVSGESVRAVLGPGFTLGVKQNGAFLAALPEIVETDAFECIGLIRHPREVFTSWISSTAFPISQGRLPGGEKRWPDLADIAQGPLPLPEKMAHIYEAIVERLTRSELFALLRYEDIVDRPDQLFRVLELEQGDVSLVSPHRPASEPAPECKRSLDVLTSLQGAAVGLYDW